MVTHYPGADAQLAGRGAVGGSGRSEGVADSFLAFLVAASAPLCPGKPHSLLSGTDRG